MNRGRGSRCCRRSGRRSKGEWIVVGVYIVSKIGSGGGNGLCCDVCLQVCNAIATHLLAAVPAILTGSLASVDAVAALAAGEATTASSRVKCTVRLQEGN